ncbi:MAG: GYF domain-containing protein, partial [Planktothrix sp.]
KELGERQARNPRTGEVIIAKPRTKPRFKFYDSFEKMIQDEVEGRGVRDKGQGLNTASNTASNTALSAPPPPPQDLITPPSPVPPPPAEMVSRTWHISLNGEKVEPVAENQLVAKGVTSATPIWSEGTGWKRAGEIPELKYLFAA